MSYATLVRMTDPFHPMRGREIVQLAGPGPLAACAPKTDKPFIILRNGEAVLRADWQQPVERGDLIAVVLLPQGGGGSNPLKIVLMIAVAIYAPEIAFGLFGEGTGAAAMEAFVSSTMGKIAIAGVNILGSALINTIIPPPKPNSSAQMSSSAAPSPTYSLSAQGNAARLESAIPVQYGRLQSFPDFAAMPYVEYSGNEQYLYQLLSLGVGEYDIEAIRIEDTSISNFAEITYQVVNPGETLTLFPSNVITSIEVAGQEAIDTTWLGPFTASPAGSPCNTLGVDVVMPRGLYYANDDGGLNAVSVTWTVQAREIDDDGDAVGDWFLLGTEYIEGATTTPQRDSFRYGVPDGRYEVRLQRNDTKQTDSRYGHELVWAGLRAYLPETNDFGNVTLVAFRMRASNNLSSQASRKINVIATRKLRTWSPTTGWSTETVPSRSIAWAIADAASDDEYGAGLPDARIGLAELYALDQVWEARNNHFDARFDSTITLWEAVSQIAKTGRAKPYMQGGILYVVRDQAQSSPVALFSMRNIKRGTFSLEFLTPSDDTSDAVTVGYFDSTVWSQRRVPASLVDSSSTKAAKIDLFGVTDRQHAYEEGLYYCAANRYRRTIIRFQTEMEGFIPAFADLIAISHDLPAWGQGGELVAWDAATKTAIVSEPLTWDTGTHYIGLRRRDGSVSGPYAVTAGTDAYHVVLATEPDFTPYVGNDEERTHFCFGVGETWRQPARITAVKPRGANLVEIEAINEDPSVHTADQGVTAPAVNYSQLPTRFTAPFVLGLTARSMPSDIDVMLLSWQPGAGADGYLIEQSSGDDNWTRCGETTAANFTVRAIYGSETIVRVAAVGLTRGPWAQISYAGVSDYMWVTGDDSAEMWTTGDDTQTMW